MRLPGALAALTLALALAGVGQAAECGPTQRGWACESREASVWTGDVGEDCGLTGCPPRAVVSARACVMGGGGPERCTVNVPVCITPGMLQACMNPYQDLAIDSDDAWRAGLAHLPPL